MPRRSASMAWTSSLALSSESSENFEHTVAWVDATSRGSAFGRGLFMRANHAQVAGHLVPASRALRARHPFDIPVARSRAVVRAFNAMHFRGSRVGPRRTHLQPFFYPLDALAGWNRLVRSRAGSSAPIRRAPAHARGAVVGYCSTPYRVEAKASFLLGAQGLRRSRLARGYCRSRARASRSRSISRCAGSGPLPCSTGSTPSSDGGGRGHLPREGCAHVPRDVRALAFHAWRPSPVTSIPHSRRLLAPRARLNPPRAASGWRGVTSKSQPSRSARTSARRIFGEGLRDTGLHARHDHPPRTEARATRCALLPDSGPRRARWSTRPRSEPDRRTPDSGRRARRRTGSGSSRRPATGNPANAR